MEAHGSRMSKTKSVLVALAIFLFVGLVAYNVSSPEAPGVDTKLNVLPTETEDVLHFSEASVQTSLDFDVTNYYIEKLGPIGEMYSWVGEDDVIVDAYKDFTLSVRPSSQQGVQQVQSENQQPKQQGVQQVQSENQQPKQQGVQQVQSEHDYEWSLDGQTYTGPQVTLKINKLGSFDLTLTDKTSGLSVSKVLHVKYVRREIRELSIEDRDLFLDTLKKLYMTDEKQAAAYGEDFTTIRDLVNIHLEGSAARDCDHLHDGMGFLSSHSAITNALENSMQMIEPAVTMPYWDYTIDGEVVKKMGSMDVLAKSVVFSDDVFGELWPEDGVVKTGRWAYTKAEKMDRDTDPVYNAYGYGRSPWNVGKSPYLTRFGDFMGMQYDYFPSCTDHKDMIDVDSLYDFIFTVAYNPHGTVHAAVGGMTGIDVYNTLTDLGASESSAESSATNFFAMTKNLWRAELLDCPTYCSDDTSEEDCVCTCPGTSPGNYSENYYSFIISGLEGSTELNTYLDMLCGHYGAIKYGEMIESASTLDPSFWPIHPTVERLLLRWRMYKDDIDESWVNNSSITVGGIGTGYCEGHNEFDQLSYLKLNGRTDYTNREVYDLVTPFEDKLPYVYHHFLWTHCSDYGAVDFSRDD